MAGNDRPKLGSAFRSSQDRTSGLSGLLPSGDTAAPSQPAEPVAPPPRKPEPTPSPEADPPTPSDSTTEPTVPETAPEPTPKNGSSGRRGRRPTKRGGRSASSAGPQDGPSSAEDIPRVVPVVLDADVLERLREQSRSSGRTHGLIALAAIEEHVDTLAGHWAASSAAPARGGLFGRTQPQHRRSAPGVQSQLRLASGDADVLDDLVARWSAPSRSALVNEALRLGLGVPASHR